MCRLPRPPLSGVSRFRKVAYGDPGETGINIVGVYSAARPVAWISWCAKNAPIFDGILIGRQHVEFLTGQRVTTMSWAQYADKSRCGGRRTPHIFPPSDHDLNGGPLE